MSSGGARTGKGAGCGPSALNLDPILQKNWGPKFTVSDRIFSSEMASFSLRFVSRDEYYAP